MNSHHQCTVNNGEKGNFLKSLKFPKPYSCPIWRMFPLSLFIKLFPAVSLSFPLLDRSLNFAGISSLGDLLQVGLGYILDNEPQLYLLLLCLILPWSLVLICLITRFLAWLFTTLPLNLTLYAQHNKKLARNRK